MPPAEIHNQLLAAVAHHRAGRLTEAEALYRRVLAADPQSAPAWHYLGVIALQQGRADVALELMNRATALSPDDSELLTNLGEACRLAGRAEDAAKCFRRALELEPGRTVTINNLGVLLRERGRYDEAVTFFERALQTDPQSVSVYLNLAYTRCDQGQFDQALPLFQRAVELNPAVPEAWTHFGAALQQKGRLDEAIGCFARALAVRPGFGPAERNLGHVCFEQGRVEEAVAHLQRAMAVEPDSAATHSDYLMIRNYQPGVGAATLLADNRRWYERHGAAFAARIAPHDNSREPGRPLRIGYVSPDFRNHALGCNLMPLFRERTRGEFVVTCYSNVRAPDAWTERFRAIADEWREITHASDDEVAAQVRADRVDILVDLALHTAHNRLGVFARKPAPVQATFAGYPGTTGLATIDYRLTDPYLDPPGQFDACYAEQSLQLPVSFWCYEPHVESIAVGPLPALRNGYVTFGCLNSSCKVNTPTLVRWAEVLRAVPASRLLLLAAEGAHRQGIRELLAQHGVAAERVEFVTRAPRERYFQYYHAIDVSLDTLPYNGHTTSLDSYWMGVPVVTLVGPTVVGRAGWSQLNNLGRPEFAAWDEAQFVAIAVELARDLPRLAELRRTLRPQLEASPLMDAAGFTRGVEGAYRTMWRRWCEAPGG